MEIRYPIYEDLEFEQIYHLYTRVSGSEFIFRKESNYAYFLGRIEKYLLPIAEIYAYCLVPQRFSFLVCFRSSYEIAENLKHEEKELNKEQMHKCLIQPISNMLNSYSKAYNKMFQRKGALFIDYIKRERIDDEEKLLNSFKDIHLMPIHQRLAKVPEEWKYSSYKSYLEEHKPTKINRNFLKSFFANTEELKQFHNPIKN